MPSFNPVTLLCCCKFRRRRGKNSTPSAQNGAFQPIPVLHLPTGEQQQEPEQDHRHSIIGLPDIAWAVPERSDSFETGSTLNQHINDADSDLDRGRPQSTKKSSTAFDAPSHVSVGNSEEEIARRAELKRIMHQRIQDELKSDESDDDIENKPSNTMRHMVSVADLALPNSGPRDAIEFGVRKSSSGNGQSAQLNTDQIDHDTRRDSQASQGAVTGLERASSQSSSGRNGWRADAIASSPSVTRLSTHASATEDVDFTHSQKSFQLSNRAGRLDRILGPDSSFNSRQASSGDGHSALGVWLIAQGLRSRDNSTLFLDEDDEVEPPDYTKLTDNKPCLSKGKEGAHDPEPQDISVNGDLLASHGPIAVNAPNKIEPRPRFSLDAQNDRHEISSLSTELPWGPTVTALLNSFTDRTSSSDPSKSQPSPARSQQNLYKLDPKDLESMELSPFRWRSHTSSQGQETADGQISKPLSMSASQPRSQSYGNIRNIQSLAKGAHDAVSAAQSKSASFNQREAELDAIRRRFSEALARKRPEKKVFTRFREEFSDSLPSSVVHRSFRSRIHLAIPSHLRAKSEGSDYRRNQDTPGPSRGQNYMLVPLGKLKGHEREASDRSKARSNLSIRPHMSLLPTEEYRNSSLERKESATDLWQRAIRLAAETRRSSSFQLSIPNPDQRNPSSNKSRNETDAARNSTSSASDMRREVSQLTPTTDEMSSPNNSKWLIDRWVAQMRPKPSRGDELIGSLKSARLAGPPRSWSRFPSHNREERNTKATTGDRVHPRDFAVKHVTSEGQIRWATDMVISEEKQRARTLPRSFSTKFGELVKSKMSRMILSKGIRHRLSQDNFIRHASSSPARMEYPEMGIRPSESGYTELQALGREISNMKGETQLHAPERELSKPYSSRSLGDRVVALMHEATGQIHLKHDDAIHPTECPMVPLTPSLVRESIAATDVFVTPRSRFSNDTVDEEEKNGVEVESTKDQKTQAVQPESADDSSQNNSSPHIKILIPEEQTSTANKSST
ncbi:hypothetical protein F53441_8784 [Fusarium austroafricanum]|uniref:Uncharacterized protein n=1 Tax=Fusarium austroafricanum TaxID=2364996 RepID=A0A8H4NX11_9HYPO|nr:hypothetical protein F53441_8784 [Fusarium austroafricanum]